MNFERSIKISMEADDAVGNINRLRRTAELMQTLRNLSHPNLVKVFDIKTREDDAAVSVIEEAITAQTLETIIRNNNGSLREDQIQKYCRQICEALNYLHQVDNSFINRNISSSAVMITTADEVKLVVDYRMAIQLQGVSSVPMSEQSSGLNHYMAPELLSMGESCKYSRDSDIWAFGCLVYEMATGKRPYHDCRNMQAIGECILKHGAPSLPEGTAHSGALRSFYNDCVVRERRKRKSAVALLGHDFLKQ